MTLVQSIGCCEWNISSHSRRSKLYTRFHFLFVKLVLHTTSLHKSLHMALQLTGMDSTVDLIDHQSVPLYNIAMAIISMVLPPVCF